MFTGKFPFLNREQAESIELPDLNKMRTLKSDKYYINQTCCEFVKRLLNKDFIDRPGGRTIKSDPFYSNFDWIELENGRLVPPINPRLVTIILSE